MNKEISNMNQVPVFQAINDKSLNPTINPTRKLERQMCGFIIAVIAIIIFTLNIMKSILYIIEDMNYIYIDLANLFASILILCFFSFIAFIPEYAAGNPSSLKFLPFMFGAVILWISLYLRKLEKKDLAQTIVELVFILPIGYFLFMRDDESGSCFLRFKPWVYKRIPNDIEISDQKPKV